MTKEQADKIAQKIANDWKLFWMSQTQNSKQDYDNYFRRALAVDANMRAHLESLISAALVDASKVTEESQLLTTTNSCQISSSFDECAKFEEFYKNKIEGNQVFDLKLFAKGVWTLAYLAGQKSKALKLPERKDVTGKVNYEVWANVGWNNCIDEIKSLNEGK